ncbi:MAG: diguanylate cyclase [Terracidiphilus sp.]|jgi:diguanylate cyclase (GGDEF)-like protein
MKVLSGILVLLVGLILAPSALAGNLIVSSTVLGDPTGALTIADVAGRVTSPMGSSLDASSTNTAYWLCLRVRAPANGSKVVLFIRPSFLNEIRLYEAGSGNPLTWKTRVTGNRYPYRDRDRASTSLSFVVDVTAPEATYYLRFKTRSPMRFGVEAVEPAEAERWDRQRDLVVLFFATAMLCLLFWAILTYLQDRQPVNGLFALHQAVYTLFGIVATGYLAPWIPARFPQLGDGLNIVLYCAISFTPVLFCRALFRPYEPPPLLMRGLNLFLWTFPALLVAIALGYDTQAVNAAAALIKITWLYFVVIAFFLRVERTPSRRLLQIFFVSILMNNVAFWLASRSSRIASVINLTAMQVLIVDGLVIGALFAMILHTRARQTLLEAQQSALDLLLVQKKFEIERELKKQAELQAQTDYLTGLFNRRRFVESAERELERAIRFHSPLTLLMIDIDYFKAINDNWGHGIGDAVLKEVARLIRDALRSVDIFGRTGGEEFAAVLVETDGDHALEIAQRLCTIVADAAIVPPGAERIPVTISIGLAQLNGRKINFSSLLNEADRAMYNAKEAGRNRVAVCEQGCR